MPTTLIFLTSSLSCGYPQFSTPWIGVLLIEGLVAPFNSERLIPYSVGRVYEGRYSADAALKLHYLSVCLYQNLKHANLDHSATTAGQSFELHLTKKFAIFVSTFLGGAFCFLQCSHYTKATFNIFGSFSRFNFFQHDNATFRSFNLQCCCYHVSYCLYFVTSQTRSTSNIKFCNKTKFYQVPLNKKCFKSDK